MDRTHTGRRAGTGEALPARWRALPCPGTPVLRAGHRSPEERRRVLEWLNEGLRPARPGRLAREYPLVFGRDSDAVPIVAWQDEAPVSFATLWPVSFRIGTGFLHTGLVSHVFTDPEHLRRGLASRVVDAAVDTAAEAGCGLVLLWSELEALYRSLGFERAGAESLVLVDLEILARAERALTHPEDLAVDTARPEDWHDIERLRCARTCQLDLPEGAIQALRATPDLDVQVARSARGVEGFAMRGRGDDLQEVIHEWGGRPEATIRCCRALIERCAPWNELFLMSPDADDALAWALRRAGARVVRQPLAWMRVASSSALARDVAALTSRDASLEIDPLEEGRTFRVRSGRGECTLPRAALLESLFGGGGQGDSDPIRRSLRAPLGEAAVERLPLPLHVAGLESI